MINKLKQLLEIASVKELRRIGLMLEDDCPDQHNLKSKFDTVAGCETLGVCDECWKDTVNQAQEDEVE